MTSEQTQHHIGRLSRSRRWLLVLTVVLALIQLGAVYRALRLPDDLVSHVSLVMPLEIVMGIGWAAVFVWAAYHLLRHQAGALRKTTWALVAFGLYSFVRLVIFARADYDRQRLPFLFILIIFVLLILIGYWYYQARFNTSDPSDN